MHEIDRDLDTDGDVLLTLHDPNSPFAVWSEDDDWERPGPQWPKAKAMDDCLLEFRTLDPAFNKSFDFEPEIGPVEEVPVEESPVEEAPAQAVPLEDDLIQPVPLEDVPIQHVPVQVAMLESEQVRFEDAGATSDQRSDIRFRLSSKHLKSASPVFKTMLDGKWKESTLTSNLHYTLDTSEWDTDAFEIIMDVIHGRTCRVPRSVTLELLAKIAVIVDYYQCHDTVKFFSDTWIENLQTWKHSPTQLSRDLILRLWISYVFNQAPTIHEILHFVVRETRGPLPKLDLPLPGRVIDLIDRHRQEAVQSIFTKYHDLVQYFTVRNCCSSECTSILLGSLLTSMIKQGLYFSMPAPPFHGYSVAELVEGVREIQSPAWSEVGSKLRKKSARAHSCSLNEFSESIIKQVENDLKKLSLFDIGLESMADSAYRQHLGDSRT